MHAPVTLTGTGPPVPESTVFSAAQYVLGVQLAYGMHEYRRQRRAACGCFVRIVSGWVPSPSMARAALFMKENISGGIQHHQTFGEIGNNLIRQGLCAFQLFACAADILCPDKRYETRDPPTAALWLPWSWCAVCPVCGRPRTAERPNPTKMIGGGPSGCCQLSHAWLRMCGIMCPLRAWRPCSGANSR